MKLRFKIDQAHQLLKGIDAPKSIIVLEVDPAKLSQAMRNVIASHLVNGIDVVYAPGLNGETKDGHKGSELVMAKDPTLESLIAALYSIDAAYDVTRQMTEERYQLSGWPSYPPWIVFDPETKTEWLTPKTLQFYVTKVDDGWFVCDRFADTPVAGTEARTRADAIRKFYALNNRPLPEGKSVPQAVPGTQYSGPG